MGRVPLFVSIAVGVTALAATAAFFLLSGPGATARQQLEAIEQLRADCAVRGALNYSIIVSAKTPGWTDVRLEYVATTGTTGNFKVTGKPPAEPQAEHLSPKTIGATMPAPAGIDKIHVETVTNAMDAPIDPPCA